MPTERRRTRRVVVYLAELPYTDPVEYYRVEYEAVSDALHFACRDLREGRRRPVEIREDGRLIYDAEGLAAACRDREAQTRSNQEPA